MRSIIFGTAGCILLAAVWSCNGLRIVPGPEGKLMVNVALETPFGVRTKSVDLNSFVFLLIDQGGDTLHRNTVGEITGTPLSLEEGIYSIVVFNEDFDAPAFGKPYYYGSETAEIIAGESCEVGLTCVQENTGIRVVFSEDFETMYENYGMNVSGTGGSLDFDGSSENLWGYFFPGQVTLTLNTEGSPAGSVDRSIEARYMYTFLVESSGNSQENVEPVFTLSVDTTHTWVSCAWDDTGLSGDGTTKETAYSVAAARALDVRIPDIWVCGYIVGHYTTPANFLPGGLESETNLALADDVLEMDINKTLSVSIPLGSIRDELNLKTNPGNLYRKVCLKGKTKDLYFGQPGLENLKEIFWIEDD